MLLRDLVVFLQMLDHECPGYTEHSAQWRRVHKELTRVKDFLFDNPDRSARALLIEGDPELVCRRCGSEKPRTESCGCFDNNSQ